MHATAMNNGKAFLDAYASAFRSEPAVKVVDIGSQDVNGSLREVCPPEFEYIGLDFQEANGVDIVIDDPYALPLETESIDIVLSSSCFEHSEMFWLVFLEALRVLKPGGLFYLNVPSTGGFHRYPVDCWRFYPDSGKALVTWAKRNGLNAAMLESYTQKGGGWQDYVAIFIKDAGMVNRFKQRVLDTKTDYENGQRLNSTELLNESWPSQNDVTIKVLQKQISKIQKSTNSQGS